MANGPNIFLMLLVEIVLMLLLAYLLYANIKHNILLSLSVVSCMNVHSTQLLVGGLAIAVALFVA